MRQVSFLLDGRPIRAPRSETLLAIARAEGIEVPTLCHLAGRSPRGACMVCLVHEVGKGRMLPACATLPVEGQVIETDGPAVQAARRRSVELLLSDHAGDCEAPCRRACPWGIDAPVVLRQIAAEGGAGVLDEALAGQLAARCRSCPAPCQRACRRGRHDGPVAIRAILLHAVGEGAAQPLEPPAGLGFDAMLGPLRAGELQAFLAHASPEPPLDPAEQGALGPDRAQAQARRCLRCDCRRKDACALRDIAAQSGAQQRRFSGAARTPFTRVSAGERVVFEAGKCIRCGRCVQLAAELGGPGLAFLGRGLGMSIGTGAGHGLAEVFDTDPEGFAARCPTGAICLRGR